MMSPQPSSQKRFSRIFTGRRNWAIFYGILFYAVFQAQKVWASGGAGASEVSDILLGLIVILLAAKLGGDLLERIKQPAVLGELVIGIVLGNLALIGVDGFDHYKHSITLEVLAELGILILLFEVGLESSIREMMSVGLTSFLVAVVGVVAPFLLGYGVSAYFFPHYGTMVDLFIGATLCATSVGITARVLKDINKSRSKEAKIILGAAVIDDILGLVILAVIMGIIQAQDSGSELNSMDILIVCAKSIGFVIGALVVGVWLSPKIFFVVKNLRVSGVLLTVALLFCFALAWLASEMGLAAIVGAFAAGLILEDVHYQVYPVFKDNTIEHLIAPIATFLVPIFFVRMGMLVDITHLGNVSVLAFAGALTLAAFVGKQVCGLVVSDKSVSRLAVGLGMVPRGEVGLIFAGIGASLTLGGEPVISPAVYSAVVIMVMATTLITPPALQWSLQRAEKQGASDDKTNDPEPAPKPAKTQGGDS